MILVIQEADTIAQFLERYPISRTHLYREWAEGRGPRRVNVGRRVLIGREAGDTWFKSLERADKAAK